MRCKHKSVCLARLLKSSAAKPDVEIILSYTMDVGSCCGIVERMQSVAVAKAAGCMLSHLLKRCGCKGLLQYLLVPA